MWQRLEDSVPKAENRGQGLGDILEEDIQAFKRYTKVLRKGWLILNRPMWTSWVAWINTLVCAGYAVHRWPQNVELHSASHSHQRGPSHNTSVKESQRRGMQEEDGPGRGWRTRNELQEAGTTEGVEDLKPVIPSGQKDGQQEMGRAMFWLRWKQSPINLPKQKKGKKTAFKKGKK